jgi:hypothetical protein
MDPKKKATSGSSSTGGGSFGPGGGRDAGYMRDVNLY